MFVTLYHNNVFRGRPPRALVAKVDGGIQNERRYAWKVKCGSGTVYQSMDAHNQLLVVPTKLSVRDSILQAAASRRF